MVDCTGQTKAIWDDLLHETGLRVPQIASPHQNEWAVFLNCREIRLVTEPWETIEQVTAKAMLALQEHITIHRVSK